MLKKMIYLLGSELHNPDIKHEYKFLKETEKWDLKDLQNLQLKKLKKLIQTAYTKSTFYHDLMDKSGFNPFDIKTIDDIKKLPVITKKDLLLNSKKIQNTEGYKKLFYTETSGSTGEPLCFYRNNEWDAGTRSAMFRGYSWHDVFPWEKNGYFWGYSFTPIKKIKTKLLDILQNRFRLFSYDKNAIKTFAGKLKKAAYIEGYSSMIYETAKAVNDLKIGPFEMKMVKGTSENIYPGYQNAVKEAFGKKMISEYGSAETGLIAFECKYGHMHIVMENVIVEAVDGDIVVTNLNSFSFPIIRYKLGDSIILNDGTTCACGMQHLIIDEVTGRIGKIIYGETGKYPSLTLYYIFKNYVLNYGKTLCYQAKQKQAGILEIYLDKPLSTTEEKDLRFECQKYFRNDMKVNIMHDLLEREYDKKFSDFITVYSITG